MKRTVPFHSGFVLALCLLLPSLFCVQYAVAGSGTFRNGMFDFCVSVRFDATNAELDKIRTALQDGSQVLADATDGQHRFGRIRIANSSRAGASSEFWVNPGDARAYATAGLYGIRGEHINMYFAADFQARNGGADGDAYTVAHEMAHHAYGVLDEYSGSAGGAECAAPPDMSTTDFSLMDNFFTRGGRASGAAYTLNEFCVAANHDPDSDTYQEEINHKSAWETIASHPTRSAVAPAGLPVDAAPAPHTVTFENAAAGLRLALVIDHSGSMATDQRLEFAQKGAKQFTRFLEVDDALAVTSFSDFGEVNFPMTVLASSTEVDAANAAIDSLFPTNGTSIGSGLLTGLGQITGSQRSCDELVVLLSDGDNTVEPGPAVAIPLLQQEGVRVLSVAVGTSLSAAGEAVLQNVATQTGGRFFSVQNSFDLVALFLKLTLETLGNGLLVSAPVALGPASPASVPVHIEEGAATATFALAFENGALDPTFTLRDPSGQTIDPGSAGVASFVAESNLRAYVIDTPEDGEWTMRVAALSSATDAELLAFVDHDGVLLNVYLEDPSIALPEPAVVRATLSYEGAAVTGASVNCEVTAPDGSGSSQVLEDNGDPADGDNFADDGVYSGLFSDYSISGAYLFDCTAESENGQTVGGEELYASAPDGVRDVPKFVRKGSVTAIATVPVCGNGAIEGDEECDGSSDAQCPGGCNDDCTCGPQICLLCGDVDFSNDVTAGDALVVLKVAVGQGVCLLEICDTNGANGVTAVDALNVLRIAVGITIPDNCPLRHIESGTTCP